jgi:hypothetical protein
MLTNIEVLEIQEIDMTMGNYQYLVTVQYPYEDEPVHVVFNGNTEGHVFMQMESWPMHPVNNPKRYGSFDTHEWVLSYFSAPITVEAE